MIRHFLKETDFNLSEAAEVFALAKAYKNDRANTLPALAKQSWGLLFYKSSTRTRVSFEVGVNELGGFPLVLNSQQTQIGRGETVEDSAKVLSRYLHGLVIRTYGHDIVEDFAKHSTMPVINGLTDFLHPCQIYADLLTLLERWSPNGILDLNCLKGKKVTFLGDSSSNMANSWILGGAMFGMEISIAGPKEFEPDAEIRNQLKKDGLPENFNFTTDALEAVKDADMVYTDVWVSMGDEEEAAQRKAQMAPYSVTSELMQSAKPDAYFMHCLPAHAGEEVTQSVLDSDQSIIFDEAENRLHAQKAIMAKLVEYSSNQS